MQESTLRSAGLFAVVNIALLLFVLGGVYWVKDREAVLARGSDSSKQVATQTHKEESKTNTTKQQDNTSSTQNNKAADTKKQEDTKKPAQTQTTPAPTPQSSSPAQAQPAPQNNAQTTVPATGPAETTIVTIAFMGLSAYLAGQVLHARRVTRHYVDHYKS